MVTAPTARRLRNPQVRCFFFYTLKLGDWVFTYGTRRVSRPVFYVEHVEQGREVSFFVLRTLHAFKCNVLVLLFTTIHETNMKKIQAQHR